MKRQEINDQLEIARANLQSSGKNPEDVDLLVLTILRVINSGKVNGVISFRINQLTITNPVLTDVKINLDAVAESLDSGDPILLIK